MGRASFGGAADYSGLFASLYNQATSSSSDNAVAGGPAGDTLSAQAANLRSQYESHQIDAAGYAAALQSLAAGSGDTGSASYYNLLSTAANALDQAQQDAKQKAAAAQAAQDQNMADQWQNGTIDDNTWLQYVQARAASATDPQEKATWEGYFAKYSNSINDNRAESAYKLGGSINDLILYYQNKLSTLSPNNQDYRDAQMRLNDLQDQRSGTAVQDGATAISDRINKGTGTYEELAKFYQNSLKGIRPNTDLYKQVSDALSKVQDQIAQNKTAGQLEKLQYQYDAGKITGHAFAQGVRSVAATFKTSDPQKYYQLLESALKLDKAPGKVGTSSGGGGASKTSTSKTLSAHVDQLQAQRNALLSLVSAADSGAKTAVDNLTGKTITFTPSVVAQLDRTILDTYEALAAAHDAKGDHSAAQSDWADRNKYITTGASGKYKSLGVVGHNTANAAAHYNDLVLGSVKVLQANMKSPNPDQQVVNEVASAWQHYAQSLQYSSKTVVTQTVGGNDVVKHVQGAPVDLLHSVDPTLVAKAQSIAQALSVTANPNATPDQKQQAKDALGLAFGADPANPDAAGSKAFKNIAENLVAPADVSMQAYQGLQAGTVTRVIQADGSLDYARVLPQSPTDAYDGVPQRVDVKLEKGQKLVDAIIDVNGKPTKVKAVATQEESNQWTWHATKAIKAAGIKAGDYLTDTQIAQLDQAMPGWRSAAKSVGVEQSAILGYLQIVTPAWSDTNGDVHAPEVWVQDQATGQWYRNRLPIRGTQTRADGSVMTTSGPNGAQFAIDWSGFADASGVPAPYIGTHPDKVGALIGVPGGIDVTGIKGRNLNGNPTDTPSSNPAFAYFDPVTDTVKDPANRDSWWQDAQRQQRQVAAKLASATKSPKVLDQVGFTVPGQTAGVQGLLDQVSHAPLVQSIFGFAKSIGLSLGGPASAPQAPAANRAASNYVPAGLSAPAGPNISPQTGFNLSLPAAPTGPAFHAPTYSGPVLNLPKPVALPAIKVPAIVGTPTTASQVTASAVAAAKAAASVTPKVTVPTDNNSNLTKQQIARQYG